jgi:hypothetical protein
MPHLKEVAMVNAQNDSEKERRLSAIAGLVRFIAIVAGLVVIGWGLIKLLGHFWPE